MATRKQLDEQARELGHPAPERLPNKAAVEAAIRRLEGRTMDGEHAEIGHVTVPVENGGSVTVESPVGPLKVSTEPTYGDSGGSINLPESDDKRDPLPAIDATETPEPIEDNRTERAAAAIYAAAGNAGEFPDAPQATRETFIRYAKAALEA